MTGPAPLLGCQVYVDGVRLADTGADYRAAAPTVLDGLGITWGRSTVVDQPDPATCTCTVADPDGAGDFLGLLHVGHVLDVWAAGPISGGAAPVDVALDGSFEAATPARRVQVAAGAAAADPARGWPDTGRALRITPAGAGPATVAIPPGPFSTAPTAWNPIPQGVAGQSWTVDLRVALGGGCTGSLAVGLFSSPSAGPAALVGPASVIPASPGNTYQLVHAAMVIPAGGPYWVGAVLVTTRTQRYLDAVGSYTAQTLTYQQVGSTWIDTLAVWAPAQTIARCLAFSGRISDLVAVGDRDRVAVTVTAVDRAADLGNDVISDDPWLAQTIATRVKRISALAGTPFTVDVAPGPGARVVSWVDVDSQDVAGLLGDLATSGDAVLWPVYAANRGFYLWMEDPAARAAFATLAVDGGSGLVVIVAAPRPAGAITLSACQVAEDVSWEQDVSDVLSVVDVAWLAQTLDGDGLPAPSEVHTVITDPEAYDAYGPRRAGYTTQLTSSADAGQVGDRIMSRSRALGWRASALTWDTRLPQPPSDSDRAAALALADAAKRIGLPLVLTDMPAWTPNDAAETPLYVEGGSYAYTAGRWVFTLTVSPAGLTGGGIQYRQVTPTWSYRMFDPSIRYVDLYGVGA